MSLDFRPVTLDATHGDTSAMLVFRDERLVAVASCLSELHDRLAGQWYLEAFFPPMPDERPETFKSLDALKAWLRSTTG